MRRILKGIPERMNRTEGIDLLKDEQKEFKPIGILDPESSGKVLNVPILGDDRN